MLVRHRADRVAKPIWCRPSAIGLRAVLGPDRLLAKSVAIMAGFLLLGTLLWWAALPSDPNQVAQPVGPAIDPATGTAVADMVLEPEPGPDLATPALAPTATALPSPTPTPTLEPIPFTDLIQREDLAADVRSPLESCTLTGGAVFVDGTIDVRCIGPADSAQVTAVAAGRVVHIGREEPIADLPFTPNGWSWASQGGLGRHVVVDHGPFAGSRSVQTVYAGLAEIDQALVIGGPLGAGERIGAVAGPAPRVRFSIWDENERNDGARSVRAGPDYEAQRQVANALGELVGSPTDPSCPLNLGSAALPGASRAYRNGTHQGIDFGCGTGGRHATSIADGTVVFVVDDYADPTVPEREALLYNAGLAGFTPHWTLVMLYGNVVVIDHGEIEGAGNVVTISAHLEKVDPDITLGATVTKGSVVGEIGNRGTNAASLGLRGAQDPSLHLHWELFIDNWYLGSGRTPAEVTELIVAALCGAADTAGCPAA